MSAPSCQAGKAAYFMAAAALVLVAVSVCLICGAIAKQQKEIDALKSKVEAVASPG